MLEVEDLGDASVDDFESSEEDTDDDKGLLGDVTLDVEEFNLSLNISSLTTTKTKK